MKNEKLDEEVHQLRQMNIKEWSIVDSPAIEEEWLILKRATGEGKGVGGEQQGTGGTDFCYCADCKVKVKHSRNVPCNQVECPKCGEPMAGTEDESVDYKEISKMAKEKEEQIEIEEIAEKDEEEVEKMKVKDAAMQAAKLLEEATGGTAKEKQRLKLLIPNLKSLAGVKKVEEEDEEDMKKMDDDDEDVEKAGRKISKDTAEVLAKVAETLKAAAAQIDRVCKPGKKEDYDEKYGYPKVNKSAEEADLVDGLKETFALYKQGLVTDDEVGEILAQFNQIEA